MKFSNLYMPISSSIAVPITYNRPYVATLMEDNVLEIKVESRVAVFWAKHQFLLFRHPSNHRSQAHRHNHRKGRSIIRRNTCIGIMFQMNTIFLVPIYQIGIYWTSIKLWIYQPHSGNSLSWKLPSQCTFFALSLWQSVNVVLFHN